MTLRDAGFIAVLPALVALAGPVLVTPAAAQQAATTAPAGERTQVFNVDNMTCALCPITVRKAIEKVAGVKSVSADFATRTATVVYDPAIASIEAIAAASRDAGYPAAPTGNGG